MLSLQNSNVLQMGSTKKEPFTWAKTETCKSVDFISLAWEVASQGTEGRLGQEEVAKGFPPRTGVAGC